MSTKPSGTSCVVGAGVDMVEEKARTRRAGGRRRLGLLVGRPRLDREGADAETMRRARRRDPNMQGAAGSAAAACGCRWLCACVGVKWLVSCILIVWLRLAGQAGRRPYSSHSPIPKAAKRWTSELFGKHSSQIHVSEMCRGFC